MRVKTRDDPAKLLARRKEANTHAACRDVAILQYGRQSWPYRRWHDEPVTCHAAPTNRFRPTLLFAVGHTMGAAESWSPLAKTTCWDRCAPSSSTSREQRERTGTFTWALVCTSPL